MAMGRLDMLLMLSEAEAELGLHVLTVRLDPTETPTPGWRFALADPAAPEGHVFTVWVPCPAGSTYDGIKDVLKRRLVGDRPATHA